MRPESSGVEIEPTVTDPEDDTVNTVGLLLVHVPPDTLSDSVVVPPAQSIPGAELEIIETRGVGLTVTTWLAL